MDEERAKGGTLDMDTEIVSTIVSHQPGYISQELEQIVGLQTDKPLKRAFMPFGGIRVAENALEAYGYKAAPQCTISSPITARPTMTACSTSIPNPCAGRKAGIITGLPDGYGRGRIIGDYRRVALYGIDRLIADRKDSSAAGQRHRRGDYPPARGAGRTDPGPQGTEGDGEAYGFDIAARR